MEEDEIPVQQGKQPANLAAQLTMSAPEIKMYQALVIFGLQEDFISPEGGLPVDTSSGFVDRILSLVPKFRDRAGHIVWVKSELAAEATADAFIGAGRTVKKFFGSLDKELEKTSGSDMMPPDGKYNTSDFTDQVKAVVKPEIDFVIEKRYCSPFTSTNFWMTLHRNLIGDVYVCGAVSEITLYAFARDAASRAVKLHIIEDCIGYRNRSRNEYAMRRMEKHMECSKILSTDIHQELDEPLTQTGTTTDLADMLNTVMKVETPQSSKTQLSSKREVVSRHSRSEHLLLPSGELKKKSSRTKVYTRKSSKVKTPEPEREAEQKAEPVPQPVPALASEVAPEPAPTPDA
jgi:nicotinamidase-related amidase